MVGVAVGTDSSIVIETWVTSDKTENAEGSQGCGNHLRESRRARVENGDAEMTMQ